MQDLLIIFVFVIIQYIKWSKVVKICLNFHLELIQIHQVYSFHIDLSNYFAYNLFTYGLQINNAHKFLKLHKHLNF